jgi:predicted phage terminase large subunit-like protein
MLAHPDEFDGLDDAGLQLPDDEAFEAEEARRSFRRFIPYAWPIIEPGVTLIPSWEIDGMADHLAAVTYGQIRDLVINIRPRSSKSRIASVLWPVWDWLQDATSAFLTASFDLGLAREHSGLSRRLIESEWFKDRYGSRVRLLRDKRAESWYRNTAGGSRLIASPKAGTTGRGGSRLLLDDPHDTMKVESAAERIRALKWWRKAFSNRTNSKEARRVALGQRSHHGDLFSLLEEEGGWEWMKVPTRFKPAKRFTTAIGWTDPRTEEGELANPARFDAEQDRKARVTLGEQDYAAQHDQEPTPEGGTTFKREDWRYWREASASVTSGFFLSELDANRNRVRIIPDRGPNGDGWRDYFDEVLQSWDFTFKGEADSDMVVGQVWGRKGADAFLLYQVRERLDFLGARAALLNVSAAHPYAYAKLLEDAANGPAINSALKRDVPGMELVGTMGKSKPARARAVAPFVRSTNVFLPEPSAAPWVPEFIERHAQFPRVDFDDEIDALAQALNRFAADWAELADALAIATGGEPLPKDGS